MLEINNSIYTPQKTIDDMLDLLDPTLFKANHTWIEPSAGDGRIIKALITRGVNANNIYAFEIDPNCFDALDSIGCVVHKKSFLLDEFSGICRDAIIITNPPYAEHNGNDIEHGSPLFVKFMNKCIEENPLIILMITPSRWLNGGYIYKKVRYEYFRKFHMKHIVHRDKSSDIFKNTNITGGVSYFLWDSNYSGNCILNGVDIGIPAGDPIILNTVSNSMILKLREKYDVFCDSICLGKNTYAIETNHISSNPNSIHTIPCMFVGEKYKDIPISDISDRSNSLHKWKVITTCVDGGSQTVRKNGMKQVISNIRIIPPNVACSATYVVIGAFDDESTARGYYLYCSSRVIRYIIGLYRTKLITRSCFRDVPVIDFSVIPDIDSEKYIENILGIDKLDIDYIYGKIK